jgi:Phosphotransferase enzyme family
MSYEHEMMRTEVHALDLIRAQGLVPVPQVHHDDTSRELCDADYFFMEYVDADNLGMLPAAERAAYGEALGALNRHLNAIKGDHFGPLLGGDPAASWREVFTGMLSPGGHCPAHPGAGVPLRRPRPPCCPPGTRPSASPARPT